MTIPPPDPGPGRALYPTPDPLPPTSAARPSDEEILADSVVAATLSVPGVSGLHAGSFGEVGTYLAGRRIVGVRLLPDRTEVHVTVVMGEVLTDVARRVRQTLEPVVGPPVHVVVEDVTTA